MRGNLEKRGGPAPFRNAVLASLLVGGLLLLMLFCGWLYAGTSGAVITTALGVIALMLVRKVSPQFFLLVERCPIDRPGRYAGSFRHNRRFVPTRRHCPGSEPLFPSRVCRAELARA